MNLLGEDEYIRNTLDKDKTDSTEKALIEIYERLRPGEPPTLDNARSLIGVLVLRSEALRFGECRSIQNQQETSH